MKINHPVTNVEREFKEGAILASRTDTRGIITYANKAFIEISGFSEAELLGKNHNLVRHPDMPPQAFEDLWDTVKAEKPWTGIVKNRCKNGDFYWVKATVTPVMQGGRVVEYMSVRVKPSRDEIASAEALYRDLNAGRTSLKPGGVAAAWQGLGAQTIGRKLLLGHLLLMLLMIGGVCLFTENEAVRNPFIIGSLLSLLASLLATYGLTRVLVSPLKEAIRVANEILDGRYNNSINIAREDESGKVLLAMMAMQSRLAYDVHEVQEGLQENRRIRTALNSVQTNVMMADKGYDIIYLNDAVQQMFRDAAEDLRERLPNFDPEHLLGKNIDVFHRDPAHQRGMLDQMKTTTTSQVTVGPRTFRIIATPVLDEDGERIGTAVEWADLTAQLKAEEEERKRLEMEREVAAVNLRLKVALDNVSSNVMVADEHNTIIYMNQTAHSMFDAAEHDFRKDLQGFDSSKLIGANIDQFHKSPSHQRGLLERLSGTHKANFVVGGRSMHFVANPVIDPEGHRLGTVVEWTDRTEEVAVEKEVDGIVEAAREGDLSQRISTTGKSGFFLQLGQGINNLIGVVESVVSDIATVMNAMSGGDLTRPISADYHGTFGEVKEAVNETIGKLEGIVSELLDTADVIATGADEISAGNNNLSQRTEQQASSLEETASSMEQLTSTVRNNADNAQQANQVSANARQMAEKGGEVVSNAVVAMDAINASSNKIAEIIGVIDEIAFQTNLLALNASVEAARAGDQGRGFAVVATEVRNLASRSAAAAKEIKELIQDSVEKVKGGSELVNESGATLQEIVAGVKKVGDIIAEIAAASAEQSAGIDQVNQAVTSMDEVTQQNAALAEQTSAASASMTEKAREMESLVGFFQVSGRGGAGRPQARQSSRAAVRPRAPSSPSRQSASAGTGAAPVRPTRVRSTENHDDEWEEF
jgi:methyl-accepting chemotaxis protein